MSTTPQNQSYDLIVIGGGSGGLAAAEIATKCGARVALVEAETRLGGECLHSGCVPSKAFIHAARNFKTVQDQLEPWEDLTEKAFAQAQASVLRSVETIETLHDNDEHYAELGVDVIHGRATFISKSEISVEGHGTFKAQRFIIATGSKPAVPAVPGLEDNYLTNETIFKLDKLPARLVVIGGGPIGCELGQAFAMFGSQVTIVTRDARLLPRDDPEASALLVGSFQAHPRMTVVYQAAIKAVSKDQDIALTYVADGTEHTISTDQILVAVGRTASTDLDLEQAGVQLNEQGIVVNDRLQTSNKHIYAVGDVTGGPAFTHVAVDQAVVAVKNALFGLRTRTRPDNELPWCTFTSPEIAHVGHSEASLIQAGRAFSVQRLDYDEVDKAITDSEAGFIKLLVARNGAILGGSIVGGPASELIGALALAVKQKLTLKDISQTLQAYPTYSSSLQLMAGSQALESLQHGPARMAMNLLRRLTLKGL
jgi:pyruvate/2-oxoglutarate dehydrogenase complex dihydrolipoamide dehydrogenase (E3) component